MSEAYPLSELFKNAPTATSLSDLSMLFANISGELLSWEASKLLPVLGPMDNLDDITDTSLRRLTVGAANCPVQSNGSFCLTLHHSKSYAFQVVMSILEAKIVFRTKAQGTWYGWYQITASAK